MLMAAKGRELFSSILSFSSHVPLPGVFPLFI
jgi:hypothetical protein